MDLLDITQCKKDFDFRPVQETNDSLPAIAWNGFLITGFNRTSGTALNLNTPLAQILRDCYPKLSFVEIARFLERLETFDSLYEDLKPQVLAAFHLKDHTDLDELMGMVLALPFDTQNWLAKIGISPKELYPLRTAARQKAEAAGEYIFRLMMALQERKANRPLTARVIDLATNLFLAGKDPFHDGARTVEIWVRHLELLRYPPKPNQIQDVKVRQLPWPSPVQARWIQDGDSSGIEVKFNIHNSKELEKMIEELETLSHHLEDDIWKTH